ncbi:ABC transporter ATP-binding protein [Marilutibacter alkalisoli]|nr:ABC transporter ATP-binding protein [Lysobacter alkalisoli]
MSAYIRARNLTLDVPIFLQPDREATGWAGMLMGAAFDPPRRRTIRLLEDLDLDVREGDRLAILGRNGAGKSTLLRVLNRVYQPTRGQLEIQGSCQALLNMSLGFNGEATVRENIFLRGVAMGLKSSFLRDQVESILEFAGLQHKVGHRLRTLSSGQRLRLGFAISTSVQHDIMLMDEWVGTGDADFMAKARERMRGRVSGSKIVVLASHSVGLLRDICNKGIVLEGGRLVHAGDITSSLKCYHDLLARLRAERQAMIEAPADGAHVYGAIEEIRPAKKPGQFVLKGWMVDTDGAVPAGLALERDGHLYTTSDLRWCRRPDVVKHFGLSNDMCGFLAVVAVPGVSQPSELGRNVRVLGGANPELVDAELRMAPAVIETLRSSS